MLGKRTRDLGGPDPVKRIRLFFAFFTLFLTVSSVLSAGENRWDPARTWVFAVGILEWEDSSSYVSFPQKNRKDARLVELFKERGVPVDQVLFLQDASATQFAMERKLVEFLRRIRSGDSLFYYFAGHGDRDESGRGYFIPHDARGDSLSETAFSHARLFGLLEQHFRGGRIFLTADCCYSGGLVIEARQRAKKFAVACLTSALSNAPSTGHWTFTESLIDGLGGAAQVDGDENGIITLGEITEYTAAEMAFGEEQYVGFFTSPAFTVPFEWGSAGKKSGDRVGERLEVFWKKVWWKVRIIGQDRDRLQVHYLGWDEQWDEWIQGNSLRWRSYQPKVYPIGSEVEVLWEERWYRARILRVERGLHRIHYVGWPEIWDEWVGTQRLRSPSVGSKR